MDVDIECELRRLVAGGPTLLQFAEVIDAN
jgi:hypothetical protein